MKFVQGKTDQMQINGSLVVSIGPGLPKNSRPGQREKVDSKLVPKHINVVSNGAAGGRRAAPHQNSRHPPTTRPPPQQGRVSHGYGVVNRPPGAPTARPPAPTHPAPGPPRGGGPAMRMPVPQLPRGAPPGSARPRGPIPPQSVPALDPGRSAEKRKSMDRNAPGPRPPLQHKPKPKPSSLVRAMYAYDAQDTDELSFKENDRIEVLREDPSGWWKGRFRGREGMFPANYVEKVS